MSLVEEGRRVQLLLPMGCQTQALGAVVLDSLAHRKGKVATEDLVSPS